MSPPPMPVDPLLEPSFPPLLSGRRAVPGQGPMDGALEGVRGGELGAGDVIWTDSPDMVELAIVLEPDVALARAAQMLPLTMVAAADCIGALAPPQVGV
ncbi:MAG: biotin/lipoate--protein ligase family protein, partial [Hyphomicrobiaceae bacterium]